VNRAHEIATACEEHGVSLPAAALAFPLTHPSVVSVCVGAHSAEQVERNVLLYAAGVPDTLWPALQRRGLLRSAAMIV
jgi:D-threo-aldose 1-dehydrogenase